MNDRYLFKAKRKDWREFPKEEWWVQGYLFDNGFSGNTRYFLGGLIIQECKSGVCEGWYVAGTDFYEIDPSTICQCTSLKDKNGKLIWENDIVKCGRAMVVYWDVKFSSWCLTRKGWLYNHFFGESCEAGECEIVGNVIDNPELLEVE